MTLTGIDPSKNGTVFHHQKDESHIEISCPIAVVEYNKYMGGVDQAEQKCSRVEHFISTQHTFFLELQLPTLSSPGKKKYKIFLWEVSTPAEDYALNKKLDVVMDITFLNQQSNVFLENLKTSQGRGREGSVLCVRRRGRDMIHSGFVWSVKFGSVILA